MITTSSDSFKQCLSTFATGVTVVTTRDNDKNYGITINSFNSASLTPPLILFSIDKSSSLHNILLNRNFTINILSKEQQDISLTFASPNQVHWNTIDHTLGNNNCPILTECCATLECTPYAHYDGGDHTIILGEVNHTHYNETVKPLVYYKSNYHTLEE